VIVHGRLLNGWDGRLNPDGLSGKTASGAPAALGRRTFNAPLSLGGREDQVLRGLSMPLGAQLRSGPLELGQRNGWASEVGVRDAQVFGIRGGRDEHSGQVPRIVTNQDPRTRREYTREDGRPVSDSVNLKAISAHPTSIRWEKVENEARRIGDRRW